MTGIEFVAAWMLISAAAGPLVGRYLREGVAARQALAPDLRERPPLRIHAEE